MAKKQIKCRDCGAILKKDWIALSRKMLGREIKEYFCLLCLADYLECTVNDLEIKIQEFKEQGCELFL